jgi:hypothetical protein
MAGLKRKGVATDENNAQLKTKTKNNHATDVFTAHYTDQSKLHRRHPANMSATVGWCLIWNHFILLFLDASDDHGGKVGRSVRQVGPTRNNNFT